MKAKLLLFAALLLAAMLCLVGCDDGNDAFAKAEKNGLDCRVTYDLGDGTVNGNNSLLYFVRKGALLPELGVTQGTTAPTLAGYRLTGYYVKNADGTERDWDFSADRITTEELTLCTRWEKNFTIQIRGGEKTYSVDVSPEKPQLSAFRQVAWTGHTFYGFYLDENFTEPVVFPYTHALDAENPAETVYVKYLEGTYTVIRSAADFKGSINAGTNYYLDADVDLSGLKISVADTFSGSFIGNGHKITGLSVERNQTKTSDSYGLFGSIAKTAVFRDVTFEGISVTVTLGNTQNSMISHIGAFAGNIAKEATLDNLTVSGALTYNCKGRDLTDKINTGEAFGEDNGVDVSKLSATVTVTEVTDPQD